MKVLIDLNIILDLLIQREFYISAALLMQEIEYKKIIGLVSCHEITTLSYFLDREFKNREKTRRIISDIVKILKVTPVTEDIILDALNSSISDFEDAVIEAISVKEKVDYIITRNVVDFKNSRVEAVNPVVFLELYKNR